MRVKRTLRVPRTAEWISVCLTAMIGLAGTAFAQGQAPPEYSCTQSTHPSDAVGSEITGTGTGAEITLFDEGTRSRVGEFSFTGGLWFFNGGESTEVESGTRVLAFSFGDYHSGGSTNSKLCASGRYFILSSAGRRFRIYFPSAAFAAFILEIKSSMPPPGGTEPATDRRKALTDVFAAGLSAVNAKEFDLAAQKFEEASRLDDTQPAIWAQLALAYESLSDSKTSADREATLNKALEAYQKALQLKPGDAAVHNNYGLALARSSKLPEAQAELAKAAQLDPSHAGQYYYNVGALLANNRHEEQAEAAFRKAIESDANFADAYYQLGLCLIGRAMVTAGKVTVPGGTQEAFQKYLDLRPSDPKAATTHRMLQQIAAFGAWLSPPTVPVESGRVKIDGRVLETMLVSKVQPVYPELAKSARVTGVVRLSVIVAGDGAIRGLYPLDGPALLVQSALDAVARWVYKPTLGDGKPMELEGAIEVRYAMEPPSTEAPSHEPKAGVTLRTALHPSIEEYHVQATVSQTIAGRQASIVSTTAYTYNIGPVDESTGQAPVRITARIERFDMDSRLSSAVTSSLTEGTVGLLSSTQIGGMEIIKDNLLVTPASGTIDSRNRFTVNPNEMVGVRAYVFGWGEIANLFQPFVEFPERQVGTGDSWDITLPKEPWTTLEEQKMAATLVGEKQADGRDVYALSLAGSLKITTDVGKLLPGVANTGFSALTGRIVVSGEATIDKTTGQTVSMNLKLVSERMSDLGADLFGNVMSPGTSTVQITLDR